MVRVGDTIENAVTGERILFRKTSRETNGEAVVLECFLEPDGFAAAAHVHPRQDERVEVLKGRIGFRLARTELELGPGERVTVPAGVPHTYWNAGSEEAHFVFEVRPALDFEYRLATMFALAAGGETRSTPAVHAPAESATRAIPSGSSASATASSSDSTRPRDCSSASAEAPSRSSKRSSAAS